MRKKMRHTPEMYLLVGIQLVLSVEVWFESVASKREEMSLFMMVQCQRILRGTHA